MPLPLILGVGAVIAGTVRVGSDIVGTAKIIESLDTMKSAESRHKKNIAKFENQRNITSENIDSLCKKELQILESLEVFANVFEKIQGRPQFKTYSKNGVNIPEYNAEKLKEVSIGAGVLLGGIGGAAVGTAGGFAAAGATTAAVMAFGTASTGTAIASLSGAAATNATLAALGGGAIAAGGGGIALGTTMLGISTFGVGLLVGGVIFNIAGSSLSNKADEAWEQMKKAERKINKICSYMKDLNDTSIRFDMALSSVNKAYIKHLVCLTFIVETNKKTNWNDFTNKEKLLTENTVLLVNLLYNMCKVELVLVSKNKNGQNKVNTEKVNESIKNAEDFLIERGLY